jgi:integrase
MATRSTDLTSKVMTLCEAVEYYVKSRDLKSNTVKDYRKVVGRTLKDWLDLPVNEITRAMVLERHQLLAKSGTKGPGKAQANQAMRVLKAVLTHVSLNDDFPTFKNPVQKLVWYKLPRRTGCVMPDEYEKWFSAVLACENASFRDYLLLLIFTGLRKEEAATLTWADLDFNNRFFIVRETKNREVHKLPMTPVIQEILERRKRAAKENNKHVFIGRYEGTQLKRADKSFTRVQAAFGRAFLLHDLRRTFITAGEAIDIGTYTLKQLVNHRSGNDPTFGYVISHVERLRQPLSAINDYMLKNARLDVDESLESKPTSSLNDKKVPAEFSREFASDDLR